MASLSLSLRTATRSLLKLRNCIKLQGGQIRGISTKQAGTGYAVTRPLLIGGLTLGVAGYLGYRFQEQHKCLLGANVQAATAPQSQPSVVSGTKDHALYLWIHLKPEANVRACAKVVANLEKHINSLYPPGLEPDEDDELMAGVGFGPNAYGQLAGKTQKNYTYPHRKGVHGDLPSTGGDIFVHAKSNKISKLFELSQKLMNEFPAGSIDKFEDIYGWVYQEGRDLSGFIDGTENPAGDDDRFKVGVEKSTGGSYVITQKWVHKLDFIKNTADRNLEGFVGRAKSDSTELKRKAITSHVARMTGGTNFEQKKAFEIVRQSQPYGSISGQAGLFFIGYSESPENFEYMLERMVGAGGDGHHDDMMRITECIKGTYWYFPGIDELKKLV